MIDLRDDERFRNVFLGGIGFLISSIGLIVSCIRMAGLSTSPGMGSSGAYMAGSVVGFLLTIAVLGALCFFSLSLLMRSQKLRGPRGRKGLDMSTDLAAFALFSAIGSFLLVTVLGATILGRNSENDAPVPIFVVMITLFSFIPGIFGVGFMIVRHLEIRRENNSGVKWDEDEGED